MNAKDLMIGDWVIRKGVPEEPMRLYDMKASAGIAYLDQDGRGVTEKFENIEPIPLTSKILEKNNDILYGDLPILFDDGKMHYSIVECRYVSNEYERNGETFYCLLSNCVYNGGSFITPFSKIQYVHELQHALKLCGIEKEIEL